MTVAFRPTAQMLRSRSFSDTVAPLSLSNPASDTVHLHNALILGILYNASADVPGPSSRASRRITRILPDGTTITEEEEEEPSRKRLRNLVAGLPRKERLRLKNLDKAGKLGANAVGGAASLGWAGSAADMLEKKRKDEEKRKVAEDRKKVRQYKSAIGAKDWKGQAIYGNQQIAAVRSKLSLCKCLPRSPFGRVPEPLGRLLRTAFLSHSSCTL